MGSVMVLQSLNAENDSVHWELWFLGDKNVNFNEILKSFLGCKLETNQENNEI